MIAPKETKLTYRESTIRIVNQAQTLVVHWESTLDGSAGHFQACKTNWTDGELVRFAMESIDRFCNRHNQMKNQQRTQ